ncbi:MAG TPA: 4Fe-4S dicluster domain-containing protein [Candidatus Limnocylindria bacterium]|nr:4Fe-4S dicluster domain-containing protein [Candidatus Limnocylindria bacterium]
MKAKVTFRAERCKGCGLCVSVCPKNILWLDEKTTNVKGYHPSGITDQGKCIACGNCARVCPDSVITVTRDKEDGVE